MVKLATVVHCKGKYRARVDVKSSFQQKKSIDGRVKEGVVVCIIEMAIGIVVCPSELNGEVIDIFLLTHFSFLKTNKLTMFFS